MSIRMKRENGAKQWLQYGGITYPGTGRLSVQSLMNCRGVLAFKEVDFGKTWFLLRDILNHAVRFKSGSVNYVVL